MNCFLRLPAAGLSARITQPLAAADPVIVGVTDLVTERARWMWFPLSPPDPARAVSWRRRPARR